MDDVFTILADPTRRHLLEVLRQGEHSVNELVDEVDIHQPGVSRHLKILHAAGLVNVRKEAQRRLYSLRPEPLQEVDEWLSRYRALWETRLDNLAAHLARQQRMKRAAEAKARREAQE